MQRIGSRLLVLLVVATTGLVGAGAPAHGAMDRPDDWVVWAAGENWTILAEFAVAVQLPCTITMAGLNSARATADSQLDVVWNTASSGIDGLVAADLSLGAEAAAARALLLEDHNDAHAEVVATYTLVANAMGSCVTTTTTTVPPGTTTTTTTPTTSSTTSTVPRSTTTSSTTSTTTTTEPPTTTTTTEPAAVFVGEPPTEQGGTAIRPDDASTRPAIADPIIGDDDAMTSALVFDADGTVMNDGMGDSVAEGMAHTGTVSGMITAGASVVLPPGLVQKAVGPIIAIEFLVRTLIESLGTMIVPLTVFLMAAGFVLWRESRRSSPIAG